MKLAYPDNHIMALAWRDGVLWALGNDEIVQRFEKETGERLLARKRLPIEVLVDQACGVRPSTPERLLDVFVEWFNKNIWGEDPFAEVEE